MKKIPKFPILKPTYDEALSDFKKLSNLKIFLKDGNWFSRSKIVGTKYIDIDKTGMKTSNYYHWAARMSCDSANSPSPMRNWYNSDLRIGLESSKFYANNPVSALALRKYIPSQFRPSALKLLIDHFKIKSVYDPCGGWGDRLAAAQSSNIEYYCRDVNPFVFSGYANQQIDFGGNVNFELKGAEIDAPAHNYYDMVFTSPPYYKIEKYQGVDQSYLKYKKFNNWLDFFLLPMLENSYKSLKPNGIMAINISDVYVNHTINDLTTPVINFFKKNCKDIQYIGYRMNKRPNSSADIKNGIFAEPIIIGKKKE